MPKLNDAIADRLLAEHDDILEQLRNVRAATEGISPEGDRVDGPIAHLQNLNAQLAAFAELLVALNASNDGDADTEVSALTAEDFAEVCFIPDPTKKEDTHG